MDRNEAEKLVRESYCADCKGTGEGIHECNYEKDCSGFKEEVDNTLKDQNKAWGKIGQEKKEGWQEGDDCLMSPECGCEDCQKENVKMD